MPGFEWFGDEERREVGEVLETGVLFRYGFDAARKGRWKAKTFEAEFAQRVGSSHCHLVSSGTASLYVALSACGIGAGDHVIISPFTFVATFEAILGVGAVPVFADMDETLCLSPAAVRAAVTERTRAVVPVHMCGSMARIEDLKNLCDEKSLTLVEDTCQAVGGSYKGRALGTFGRMGCFSFDAVKTITCGEGGAVITDDILVSQRADQYADHGHDHIGSDRGADGHPVLGTNFRISELNAAVGLAQLRKLDRILEAQRANKKALKDALGAFRDVAFRQIPDPEGDSATFLCFFMPGEEEARQCAKELAKAGLEGVSYWYDNNWHYLRRWEHLKNLASAAKLPQHLYDHVPDYNALDLSRSDSIMGRTVCIQVKIGWSPKDLEDRVKIIRSVFGN